MVTGRVRVLNSHLKRYDRDLYADAAMDGLVTIYRNHTTYIRYSFEGKNLYVSTVRPQWVTALTKDWSASSCPIEWGIEPILSRLKTMDQWRKENALDGVRRHNEKVKANKQREQHNNLKALAADVRRDFAKATNDINTANLKKVYNRRKKDGYCKQS